MVEEDGGIGMSCNLSDDRDGDPRLDHARRSAGSEVMETESFDFGDATGGPPSFLDIAEPENERLRPAVGMFVKIAELSLEPAANWREVPSMPR